MRRTAVVAMVAGAILFVLQPGMKTANGQGITLESFIVIGKDGKGGCAVLATPTIIRGAKANLRIVWHVLNRCDVPRTVTLDNFKHKQDNNRKKNPLNLVSAGEIPAGGSADIRGTVRTLPQQDIGTYKYDVLINGIVADDPELEIDK